LVTKKTPKNWSNKNKYRFICRLGKFIWGKNKKKLCKECKDDFIRKYVPKLEHKEVLRNFHDDVCGHHMSGRITNFKVLHDGFIWPTLLKMIFQMLKDVIYVNVLVL